jgi:hypothetical protein
MIFRIYNAAVGTITAFLLILSALSIPYILEIVIIGVGGMVALLILAISVFLNKVNTRYEHALSNCPDR